MTSAHVIGNGESRKGIDFDQIQDIKIGCNAAYRDIELNYLVSVDRRMVDEALDNNFRNPIYTRKDWMNSFIRVSNVMLLPSLPYNGDLKADDPWHWGSGPHACNLAAKMGFKEIHLWGFDLWGNGNLVNNVYKGSKNYDPINKNAVDPRFWIYQLGKCFEYYSNVKWIQHQTNDWSFPKEWNFKNLSIEYYKECYNISSR